jgi:hypothetical protein
MKKKRWGTKMTEAAFWKKGFHFMIGSIIFLLLAIKALWLGLSGISADISLNSWQIVDAEIKSVSVEKVMERGMPAGNLLAATYTYQINDLEHTSNQVAIDPTFSNSPEELLAAKIILEQAIAAKKPVKLMVDPQNYKNAMLFKPVPYKSYFFTITGVFLLAAYLLLEILFIWNFRRQSMREARRIQFPEQPWKWEESWQTFSISNESKFRKILPLSILAIVMAAISVIVVILVLLQPEKGVEEYAGIAATIFFNLIILWKWQRKWRGDSWAEKIELETAAYPVIPGEPWQGRIKIISPRDNSILAGLKVFVKQNRSTGPIEAGQTGKTTTFTSGSLAQTMFREDGRSCFSIQPEIKSEENQFSLEFEFTIPADAEPTDLDGEFDCKWQIYLYFYSPAKEFIEAFEIPVYAEESFSQKEINSDFSMQGD